MASSSSQYISFITIVLLICFSTFSSRCPCSATTDRQLHKDAHDDDAGFNAVVPRMDKITKALSDAGYNAMSLTLQITLPTLLSSHHRLGFTNKTATSFTIFCPPDEAFFSLKYPQPPLTLLQYHVSPIKFDKASLLMEEGNSPSTGTKIDTLLPHHPLVVVVTSAMPAQPGKASINGVQIKKWDIYNDGVVIVHGIDNFFDPAYQTILYPWFDGFNGSADYRNTAGDNASSTEEEIIAGSFAEMGLLGIIAFGVVFYIVYRLFSRLVMLVCCVVLDARGYLDLLRQHRGGGYALLEASSRNLDVDSPV